MKNDNPALSAWVGKRIKLFRSSRGITQEQLAEYSGLHRTYIGACERGEKNITIMNLSVICNHLHISLKTFFDDEIY
ncbi:MULTISPECIES: helix-turn-helix domain-containing protein [unclassified Pseudomonas]|nr:MULTISPECIES: helix-turn-helix transcriptional regulator [unclassified Pseudomonas]